MDFTNSATTILEWLKIAIDDTSEGKRVKERYMMNKDSWKVWYRPDCNIETAYAFLKAWEYTKDNTYLDKAIAITNFSANNLYYSDDANANGVIRGAYNIQDDNWDTSSLILNSGQEGGADMVYTGWVNAPLTALFFTLSNINNYTCIMKVYDGSNIINIPIYEITEKANGCLRIYLNNKINYIPLVEVEDKNASNIHLYINKKIKSLKGL